MNLRGSMTQENDQLQIGGLSLAFFAEKYGTPLMILDQIGLEENLEVFKNSFQSNLFETDIAYASKAMLNIHLAKTLAAYNFSFDVSSMGEIYILQKAGVNLSNTYFHGNNKTKEELDYAIKNNVGTIIVDNSNEYSKIVDINEYYQKDINIMLRINPGIETDTHEYIQTSSSTSKFGMSIDSVETLEFIEKVIVEKKVKFLGFHSHIGSQIFEELSFFKASKKVLDFQKEVEEKFDYQFEVLNLGGGFGVYYTESDSPFEMGEFLEEYIQVVEREILKRNLKIRKVVIEPGRSIINDYVSSLYRIGASKQTPGNVEYLFVDGGMSDNIRPALYQAKYEAYTTSKSKELRNYRVAGKLCESGDVLIDEILLPKSKSDDLLLIPSTGAYTYSMSSNYNKALRPAMVAVKDKETKLILRKESLEDLIFLDVIE